MKNLNPSEDDLSNAYWRGFSDGRDDLIFDCHYDQFMEKELFDAYTN